MKMPTMSFEDGNANSLELGQFKVEIKTEEENAEDEPTEFPCNVCSAKFVTRMSLIRHMILHEEDEDENDTLDQNDIKPQIQEQNLLETILKNGSNSFSGINGSSNGSGSSNGVGNGTSAKRPIPNLKPLPSLIQINEHQQQEKSLQCQLCGVWFRKKEDLSRHVTRTHGSAKFTCPYCQRNISRRDHLKRHIRNVHPEFCTPTEVGPFVNQGAGRPPKQPSREVDNGMDEQPPPKRQKLMNGYNSSGTTNSSSSSSMNDAPILQNFLTEMPNHIRFINESKIEAESETDDANERNSILVESELQFPVDPRNHFDEDQYQDENELFDDSGNDEEFVNDLNNKPEFRTMLMKGEEPEEFGDEEPEEELDFGVSTGGVDADLSFGMLPEDTNNSYSENETENQEDENGNGISEYEEESILKPLLGGSTERKFKCDLCDAAFMSSINMERHMTTHSVSRPHKCSVCGKGFLRKEHLTKHLSSVHSGMKYRCQFCRKDISRKDHLLRHIRNCHPQEFMGMSLDMIDSVPQISQVPAVTLSDNPNMRVAALSCDMCSEIFNHIDELMEHQSDAHSDIRKFKCETCPKSFKRKEHLLKHSSTHVPPAPKSYSCSECNQVFPSLAIAHAHLRQVHGQKNSKVSAPATTTPLPCNLCENTFQQRAHLLQHLKAYHGVSNPERRFTDPSFNNSTSVTGTNVVPSAPAHRPMISIPKTKPTTKQFQQGSHVYQNSIDKPQIRSLLGIHAVNRKDEGSLGSLMGLINKGSISLSLSKIGK